MRTWLKHQARGVAYRAEWIWDRTRFAAKTRLGLIRRPLIMPYRGFGSASAYWVKGRVIDDPEWPDVHGPNSLGRDLWLTFKRYETDEVPRAKLRWSFGDLAGEVTTDAEGFFEFRFNPERFHMPDQPWQSVTVELIDSPVGGANSQKAQCLVRTPGREATLGIISDIDDTIIKTGATQLTKHWRTVIANSARSRTGFPGLAAFYRGMVGERERNPVFYVSSSPWNLFDLLEKFLALHKIPLGSILLKDFGLSESRWITGGHLDHKTEMIDAILAAYPNLPFVLVGDSGQSDAFVGLDVAERHPGRIAAVYLREIEDGTQRAKVEEALNSLRAIGVDTACGPDLCVAAEHAAARGWMGQEQLEAVRRDIQGAAAK